MREKILGIERISFKSIYLSFKEIFKILGSLDYSIYVEKYMDPEIPDYEKTVIGFKIKSEDFEKLQKIWDKIINVFYKNKINKNMIIVVEPE